MKPEYKKQILDEVSKLLDNIEHNGNVCVELACNFEYHNNPSGELEYWLCEEVTEFFDDYETHLESTDALRKIVKIVCATGKEITLEQKEIE